MHPHTILNSIADLPRIPLARKNTAFEEMPRLRAAIAQSMDADISAVPPLFIKRDDTTGFAFGGNKARGMEFLFAHFLDRGIDTLININHYDSNNARLVAAAAAKSGMKYHWAAFDHLDAPIQGNMLIAHLAGANIHRVPDQPTAQTLAQQLLHEEQANNRTPTIVSQNPFFDIAGMIAYLETAHEIENQITNYTPPSRSVRGRERSERGMHDTATPRHSRESRNPRVESGEENPLSPSGERARVRGIAAEGGGGETPLSERKGTRASAARSQGYARVEVGPTSPIHFWGLCGRSIAGIILYARNTGKPWTATAVAQPHYNPENYQQIYLDRSTRVAHLLNLDTPLNPGDITTLTGYTITYGVPTDLGIQAMHLVAKTEGIILDPNYTAKSMSALIAQIQLNNLDPDIPVIFIHSGGTPQTFAHPNQIWNY